MTESPEAISASSYKFKVIVVGSQGVGKTSLIRRFVENKFKDEYTTTIGTDITLKNVDVSFGLITYQNRLMIWDLAGQPRYETLHESFIKGAHAAMVVASQDDPESFYGAEGDKFTKRIGVRGWIELVNQQVHVPTILLINKADLEENKILDEEIVKVCEDTNILGAYRTSAKNGLNVTKVFNTLAGMPLILARLRYIRHW
ncbi:MAG: GTP-binding protein [Promethearchaeota archaeon CR_4]|nr:MAG: GTP-binding protein [Candidatus Lokiarchaeota archaeon CR_4]